MDRYVYRAEIICIIDGDTLDAIVDLGFDIKQEMRLRLHGINTPEQTSEDASVRDRAKLARDRLFALASLQRSYLIKTIKINKYSYQEAIVFLDDGKTINDLLVEEGLASKLF